MPDQYALGIDIGGTFTDVVVFDGNKQRIISRKLLTTHDDPARAVLEGIRSVINEDGIPPDEIGRVVHATTLFTNALIERKGAQTGLLTTEGFEDIIEIGRERKYELYDIHIQKPSPLAPQNLRCGVRERLNFDGSVAVALDEQSVAASADHLVSSGVQSIAISFLHSYANPAHELATAAIIQKRYPHISVSLSSDVAPEIREFERTSTVLANAYIKPLAAAYLDGISLGLKKHDIASPLLLMLSNGGLADINEAKRIPVALLESGPAAGALAAAYFGTSEANGDVLAFDMGGTTAKLSVVDNGKPDIAYNFEAARQKRFAEGSGLPIRTSTVELIEIGAGGGSIARLDEINLLKVGPDSAGSDPGPAIYGLGGKLPTVTDANFALGLLSPETFAGGSMPLDSNASLKALDTLSVKAGLSREALAAGIREIVNETMASAARVHIAERGKDPRRYALLATGGGGPLHGADVARKLGLKRLISPASAGVASAIGLLIAPARVDRVATVARRLDQIDWPIFEDVFARLELDAQKVIDATGLDPKNTTVIRRADVRYVGQAFEVIVDLPTGPYNANSMSALILAFEAAYVSKFTRKPPAGPVEIINARVGVSVSGQPLSINLNDTIGNPTGRTTRKVWSAKATAFVNTDVYSRYSLRSGDEIDGPALVEERESTLVIPEGAHARVATGGEIVVDLVGENS
jgi:N-methylhydantoinase A